MALGLAIAPAILYGAVFALHVVVVGDLDDRAGIDYRQYSDATARWLSGGTFYQPWQLAGPYIVPERIVLDIPVLPVLYPPTTLPLFVVGHLLPAPLWWAIPLGLTAYAISRHRPRPWTWPALTLCVCAGDSVWLVISGNPIMWAMATLAIGTHNRWSSVGVLLKPGVPLLPFALFGVTTRRWWYAAGAAGLLALLFLPMWPQYLTVLRNASGTDLTYSIGNVPLMLIPLVAWTGRRPRAPD